MMASRSNHPDLTSPDVLKAALGQTQPATVIGLMSGTSADAVDACAVILAPDAEAGRVMTSVLGAISLPIPEDLAGRLFALMENKAVPVSEICMLNKKIGNWFADAAHQLMQGLNLTPDDVLCIGSHGQTVSHLPDDGSTLQLGEAAYIAEKTGVSVVSNFRSRDMAAGGQGAPLVPFSDLLLFGRQQGFGRLIQNIGGIANVTVLPPSDVNQAPFAFDTGPGNMLIDGAMQRLFNQSCDKDGEIAGVGQVDEELLQALMAHPYYEQMPPKSCGREAFGRTYLEELLEQFPRVHKENILATLTKHTALSIVNAYDLFVRPELSYHEMVVCGGGAFNPTLMSHLKHAAEGSGLSVVTTQAFNLDCKLKEAIS
ncbi:MAG: anhydro-N-acetylmuramic acid kinase, partial [Vampirovibrionales bacterium]|nr:anhydro-N-acetylmuramic acid kinase [Vampirovibrionales bacterium]